MKFDWKSRVQAIEYKAVERLRITGHDLDAQHRLLRCNHVHRWPIADSGLYGVLDLEARFRDPIRGREVVFRFLGVNNQLRVEEAVLRRHAPRSSSRSASSISDLRLSRTS